MSVGATIGLPGYSSVRACIEATGEAGETEPQLRARLEGAVLAQLARQVAVAIQAAHDPAAFVKQHGDPADPEVAAFIGV